MKRLLLAMLLASCHPAPAFAHEADVFLPKAIIEEMNADAKAVCDAGNQGDSNECLDIVFDSFIEAVEMGATSTETLSLVEVLTVAHAEVGCNIKDNSPVCKFYPSMWGAYYVLAEGNKEEVLNGNTTQPDGDVHP